MFISWTSERFYNIKMHGATVKIHNYKLVQFSHRFRRINFQKRQEISPWRSGQNG